MLAELNEESYKEFGDPEIQCKDTTIRTGISHANCCSGNY